MLLAPVNQIVIARTRSWCDSPGSQPWCPATIRSARNPLPAERGPVGGNWCYSLAGRNGAINVGRCRRKSCRTNLLPRARN